MQVAVLTRTCSKLLQADLERARESFVMTTELHLTYLCVPVMEDITPDWGRFYEMVRRLQVRGPRWLAMLGHAQTRRRGCRRLSGGW